MTRSEIISYLESRLNSATWSQLKSSLLGKELINFAAVTVELSQLYEHSVRNSQYVDKADLTGLLAQAYMRDTQFDLNRPSFVKLQITDDILIPPLRAALTSGSANFTNLKFLKKSEPCVLVKGVVKTMKSDDLVDFTAEVVPSYKMKGSSGDVYFRLGQKAVAESVKVYLEINGNLVLFDEYNSMEAAPSAYLYKLLRDENGNLSGLS